MVAKIVLCIAVDCVGNPELHDLVVHVLGQEGKRKLEWLPQGPGMCSRVGLIRFLSFDPWQLPKLKIIEKECADWSHKNNLQLKLGWKGGVTKVSGRLSSISECQPSSFLMRMRFLLVMIPFHQSTSSHKAKNQDMLETKIKACMRSSDQFSLHFWTIGFWGKDRFLRCLVTACFRRAAISRENTGQNEVYLPEVVSLSGSTVPRFACAWLATLWLVSRKKTLTSHHPQSLTAKLGSSGWGPFCFDEWGWSTQNLQPYSGSVALMCLI